MLWAVGCVAIVVWLVVRARAANRDDGKVARFTLGDMGLHPSVTIHRVARTLTLEARPGHRHEIPLALVTDVTFERAGRRSKLHVWTAGQPEIVLEGVVQFDRAEAVIRIVRQLRAG